MPRDQAENYSHWNRWTARNKENKIQIEQIWQRFVNCEYSGLYSIQHNVEAYVINLCDGSKIVQVVQRKMLWCSDVLDFQSSEINIRNPVINFKIIFFLRAPRVFVLVSLLRIQRHYNMALCLTERLLTAARCIDHPMGTSALPDRTLDTTGSVSVETCRFPCTAPLETFCQVMIRCWEIPSLTLSFTLWTLKLFVLGVYVTV